MILQRLSFGFQKCFSCAAQNRKTRINWNGQKTQIGKNKNVGGLLTVTLLLLFDGFGELWNCVGVNLWKSLMRLSRLCVAGLAGEKQREKDFHI